MADGQAATNNTFDAEKMKQDILEQTKAQNEQFMKVVMETVNKRPEVREAARKADDEIQEDMSEYSDYFKELGVDDPKAMKALVGLVEKLALKKSGKLKEDVIKEVDDNAQAREKKRALEVEMASKYPQILDRNSQLWKETSKVYEQLSEAVKSSPDGTSIAIKMAAANLNIAAVDLNSVRAHDSINNTNSGGSGNTNKRDMTEKQKNFAQSFKVDPRKFEAKLKEIRERSIK